MTVHCSVVQVRSDIAHNYIEHLFSYSVTGNEPNEYWTRNHVRQFFLMRITRGDRKKKYKHDEIHVGGTKKNNNNNKGLATKRWGGKGIHFFWVGT